MEVLKKLYFLIPTSIVITMLVYAINYLGVTELEKKLMTNFEKLKVNLSLNFFASIIITLFSLFLLHFRGEAITSNLIIGGFILSFLLWLLSVLTAWAFNSVFMPESKYWIHTGNEKWLILRVNHNKILLLKKEKNEFKTITDYSNMLIKRENTLTWWQKSFYRKSKMYWIIFFGMLILTLAIICSIVYFDAIIKSLLIYPLIMSLIGTVFLLFSPALYKKIVETKEPAK